MNPLRFCSIWMLVAGWCSIAAAQDPQRSTKLSEQASSITQALDQAKWDEVFEHFDKTMKSALPKDALTKTWGGINKQFGSLKSIAGTRHAKADKYDVVLVTCEFERGRMDLKLVFDADDHVAGLFLLPAGKYTPPAYAKTKEVSTREVSIGRGLLNLPGTLMLPAGASNQQPVAAVVLVHGSGPQDRDETIGPNKPFLDLAYGLASQGIAVLRYEKRTKQFATVMAMQAKKLTVKEETVDDAVAAFELLRQQPEIDPQQVYILGHSLGGNLLPRIGALTPQAAGYIGLAASARPLEDLVLQQTEEILASSKPSAEEQAELEKLRAQVAKVKSNELTADTPASELPLGIPAAYWLDLRDYQPAEQAKKMTAPLFLAQGGRDYQVTDDDWKLWQAALKDKSNCTLKLYENLNHLFMPGQGRSQPSEYTREGHVDEQLINDLAAWISNPSKA